ncbi:MAG: hypothetical protein WA885_01470 [Phormidesmis sp.]
MVSSNMSQSVSSQPDASLRAKRERSQPTLWGVATVFFLMGAAASAVTIWQLHRLYVATVAPLVTVTGQLQAQYEYKAGNELTPTPGGYFVDSPSTGRIYMTGQPLNSYVGQTIEVQGSVSGICGPKSIPCFPLVTVREVSVTAEAE